MSRVYSVGSKVTNRLTGLTGMPGLSWDYPTRSITGPRVAIRVTTSNSPSQILRVLNELPVVEDVERIEAAVIGRGIKLADEALVAARLPVFSALLGTYYEAVMLPRQKAGE